MSFLPELDPTIIAAARALGLIDRDGALVPEWFQQPLDRVRRLLEEPVQRAALLELIDAAMPRRSDTPNESGVRWHPLLRERGAWANVFVTFRELSDRFEVGLAARAQGPGDGDAPLAQLQVDVPLVRVGATTLEAITDEPLRASVRIRVGWTRPNDALALAAIRIEASATLAGTSGIGVVLEGADLGDGLGTRDVRLDPATLGHEAFAVLSSLVRQRLARAASSLVGGPARVAAHLPAALGFDDGIPSVAWEQLGDGAAARAWLRAVVDSDALPKWLGEVAGLVGGPAPGIAAGAATPDDPLHAVLVRLSDSAELELTAHVNVGADGARRVVLGLRMRLSPGAPAPARIAVDVQLVAIPIDGTADVGVLPGATVLVRAPGSAAARLVDTATARVGALQAGVQWNGSRLEPRLELLDVAVLAGVHPRVDLTHAGSVVALAGDVVRDAIVAALGATGPGRRLAALAGLLPPLGDPGTPHLVDVATLAGDPLRAIADVHAATLQDAARGWGFLLAELAALLGIADAVSGTGSADDPWRIAIGTSEPLVLQLVAWNASTSEDAGTTTRLRLGVRAAVEAEPWSIAWHSALLAYDRLDGDGTIALFGEQRLIARVDPIPEVDVVGGVGFSASALQVEVRWPRGGSLTARASIRDLVVGDATESVTIAELVFPPPQGADPAALLGIADATLAPLLRHVLVRALHDWSPFPGLVVAGLFGLHGALPGVATDWPTFDRAISDALADPAGALRAWLAAVATRVGADGLPFAPTAVNWLGVLLGRSLQPVVVPDDLVDEGRISNAAEPPSLVLGGGHPDDPWAIPVAPGSAATLELLAWLEPAGPPVQWIAALPQRMASAPGFGTVLDLLAHAKAHDATLRTALEGLDRALVVDGLNDLEVFLSRGDGMVELAAQVPEDSAWTAGEPVDAPHARLPRHPAAIEQVLARVESLAPTDRVVLLLGPRFTDRTVWTELLARAEAVRPGSTNPAAVFALRDQSSPPLVAIADYYVAELRDEPDVTTDDLVAALGRIVDELAQLRPGVAPIVVAHSTAGVCARVFTERNPTRVLGLVTLGTPHVPRLPAPLVDDRQASGVRLLHRLFPEGFGDDAMGEALQHLLVAQDGGVTPSRGAPQRPLAYPLERFASATGIDTAGVSALAIGSSLAVPLLEWLRTRLVARIEDILAHADAPPPTHVAFGARVGLPLRKGDPEQTRVDATVRIDGGRLRFAEGPEPGTRPTLALDVAIARTHGWLVGHASSFAGGAAEDRHQRLRRVRAGLDWIERDDGVSIGARLRIDDVAIGGDTIMTAELGDATSEAAIGALTRALAHEIGDGLTPLGSFFGALTQLELAVRSAQGTIGISADAYRALRVDPRGFLEPRLRAALGSGALVGFSGPPSGPWRLDVGDIELELSASPWSIGLRTRDPVEPATDGFTLAPGVALPFHVSLALPSDGSAPVLDAEATLRIGRCSLSWSSRTGRLVLDAPPFETGVELVPTPAPSVLSQRVRDAIPRLLLSSALSAALRSFLDESLGVGPLHGWLSDPGAAMAASNALGSDGRFDGTRIAGLLGAIARALGQSGEDGVRLPGAIALRVAGNDPLVLSLATIDPIGDALSFDLGLELDAQRHAAPRGTIALRLPLAGSWPAVTIGFGLDANGLLLAVTPEGSSPIQLLPRFGGLGALAGTAAALLPRVLDEVVDALGPANDRSDLARLALRVAEAVGIYDEQGGFAAHEAELRELASDGALGRLDGATQARWVAAVVALFEDPTSPLAATVPGTWIAEGARLTWRFDLDTAVGRGALAVTLGWDAGGPCLRVTTTDLELAEGAVIADASFGIVEGRRACDATIRMPLESSLGIPVEPAIVGELQGDRFAIRLLPLGVALPDAPTLQLVPTLRLDLGTQGALPLLRDWLLPLAGRLALDRAAGELALALWNGGPTTRSLLQAAALIELDPAGGDRPKLPLPDASALLGRLVRELARTTTPTIELLPTLSLAMVDDDGVVGMRLRGRVDVGAGALQLSPLFGETAASEPRRGITLELFRLGADTDAPALAPALSAIGLGVGLQRADGTPLVSGRGFSLGSVAATAFFRASLDGGFAIDDLGAELAITRFGLPLGQASRTGGNPVASSLLGSGTGLDDGDQATASPTIDVFVARRGGELRVRFAGQDGPVWIDMQRGFGPVYIERVGVKPESPPGATIMIDGSAKVGGLRLGFDGLGVRIPLEAIASPGSWTLALDGLSTTFQSSAVTITGGLAKVDGPPLEYRGAMLVEVAERTFAAIGAYARPSDALGGFTSLFVFASVPAALGGPPFFFVTELAGGFGYNRGLVAPTEPDDVESFPLLAVLDDDSLVADPLRALATIGSAIPPKRGSVWVAAGVEFTTFERLKTRAVLYASLDRALEVGLVGISRMTLPTADAALVHVELGLLARYSEAERLLSVRAQLTDSSWLLSRDCELTGGFAFFLWFAESQFVLTLGGYAPSFARPARFPVVPRLGFDWQVDDHTVVKGGCYFALTNSCLMTGGNLEAVYERGSIRAWFDAEANILISWDPFQYDVEFSIDVGASWTERICFIKCVTLHLSVSIGATLHLMGPPLRGEVTVRLAVASVTIGFGDPAHAMRYIEDWAVFVARYLTSGGPSATPVAVRVVRGLLPPADDTPPDPSAPWVLDGEPELLTDTRMPAASYASFVHAQPIQVPNATRVDIAPMAKTAAGPRGVRSHHAVALFRRDGAGWSPVQGEPDNFEIEPQIGQVPEATWRFVAPEDLAAAANTLPALLGLRIRAVASFAGRTPVVAVDRLSDTARVSHPLPFAVRADVHPDLQGLGTLAESVSRTIDDGDPRADTRAASAIVAGDGLFAAARERVGVRATGLSPVALDGLQHNRTSAPRIVPLAADLAMRSNALAAPPTVSPSPRARAMPLDGARLRAVVRLPEPPNTATTLRTTVADRTVPRIRLPQSTEDARARLVRIDANRPSTGLDANDGGTTLTHPLVGGRMGAGRLKRFEQAARDIAGEGVTLATGSSHLWQLPAGRRRTLAIRGGSAWRAIQMARSGEVLHDVEGVGDSELAVDGETDLLAVMALGTAAVRSSSPQFAGVSARHARAGDPVACGWELGQQLPRFGERTMIARGSVVLLPRPGTSVARRRTATTTRIAEHAAAQPGIETWLPLAASVAIVRLDLVDPTAADAGDLGVSIRGARAATPLRVDGDRRLSLVYPLLAEDGPRPYIELGVASRHAFRIAGVVGVSGTADEWAERLRRSPAMRLVSGFVVGPAAELRIALREDREP